MDCRIPMSVTMMFAHNQIETENAQKAESRAAKRQREINFALAERRKRQEKKVIFIVDTTLVTVMLSIYRIYLLVKCEKIKTTECHSDASFRPESNEVELNCIIHINKDFISREVGVQEIIIEHNVNNVRVQ